MLQTDTSPATTETGNKILDNLFYWNSLEAYVFWAAFIALLSWFVQQSINMALYKEFEQTGIEFAYPTYSLKVNGRIKSKQNGMELIVSDQ